jgi:hypothetical protein
MPDLDAGFLKILKHVFRLHARECRAAAVEECVLVLQKMWPEGYTTDEIAETMRKVAEVSK